MQRILGAIDNPIHRGCFSLIYACGLRISEAATLPVTAIDKTSGLLRVVGSFGDCPRCLAVCPVGNDYHAHLADIQKVIPEKTPEKTIKAAGFKQARKEGHDLPGLSEWNVRWVGEKGYQGIVAKQLQEFKRLQKEKEEEEKQ